MLRIREKINSWPGFVDLFSNLVIILIFLLIVFVFLWTTTSVFSGASSAKKFKELTDANAAQLAQIQQMTSDANDAHDLLVAARDELVKSDTTATELQDENVTLTQQVNDKNTMLQKVITDYENALKNAQDHNVAVLADANAKQTDLQNQIAQLQSALDAANAKATDLGTQYTDLSNQLNKALADKVAELQELQAQNDKLSAYQSEFFGAVRTALGDFNGVDVSSDRFVIPSDILFASGKYTLSADGKNQLGLIANVIKQLEGKIPTDVAWIIRVDGHTDSKAVIHGTAGYSNNMQLSLLRARAVVNELVRDGVARNRLVPAGFGDMQPAALGSDAASLQRDRRIELRLTNP